MYLSTVFITFYTLLKWICFLGMIWTDLYTELDKVNHHNTFVYTTDFVYTNFK